MKNDNVNHPKHYTSSASGFECIEFTKYMLFAEGNAFKYAWRAFTKKNTLEDLEKCKWYINLAKSNNVTYCDIPMEEITTLNKNIFIVDDKHENTGRLCFLIWQNCFDDALKEVDRILRTVKND